jgi:hypothetical protein
VVSIVDLIALTSFQSAGGVGFVVANCEELAVLSVEMVVA